LMAAVRWYLDLDHAALMQTYEDQVGWIVAAFTGMQHVSARRSFPSEAGQPMPRAEILLDEPRLSLSRDEVLRRLYAGSPAIHLAPAGVSGIFVNPQTLQPGQEKIVVERIKEILG